MKFKGLFILVFIILFAVSIFAQDGEQENKGTGEQENKGIEEQDNTVDSDEVVTIEIKKDKGKIKKIKKFRKKDGESQCEEINIIKIEDKETGDLALNIGMNWLMPIGNMYDKWNNGFGFKMGLDFFIAKYFSLGITFADMDLDPNSSGYSVDTTGWDANILNWSLNPKVYFVPGRLYLTASGGWYGIRRNIPTYASLDSAVQATLQDENNFGFEAGLGGIIWNFLILELGYQNILDEGHGIAINLLFHL
ncbi:MAG: hypothetical protein ABIA04_11965 [Pseudomonadota bacterium]